MSDLLSTQWIADLVFSSLTVPGPLSSGWMDDRRLQRTILKPSTTRIVQLIEEPHYYEYVKDKTQSSGSSARITHTVAMTHNEILKRPIRIVVSDGIHTIPVIVPYTYQHHHVQAEKSHCYSQLEALIKSNNNLKKDSLIKLRNFQVAQNSKCFNSKNPDMCLIIESNPKIIQKWNHHSNTDKRSSFNSANRTRNTIPSIESLGGEGMGIIGSPLDVHGALDVRRALHVLQNDPIKIGMQIRRFHNLMYGDVDDESEQSGNQNQSDTIQGQYIPGIRKQTATFQILKNANEKVLRSNVNMILHKFFSSSSRTEADPTSIRKESIHDSNENLQDDDNTPLETQDHNHTQNHHEVLLTQNLTSSSLSNEERKALSISNMLASQDDDDDAGEDSSMDEQNDVLNDNNNKEQKDHNLNFEQHISKEKQDDYEGQGDEGTHFDDDDQNNNTMLNAQDDNVDRSMKTNQGAKRLDHRTDEISNRDEKNAEIVEQIEKNNTIDEGNEFQRKRRQASNMKEDIARKRQKRRQAILKRMKLRKEGGKKNEAENDEDPTTQAKSSQTRTIFNISAWLRGEDTG